MTRVQASKIEELKGGFEGRFSFPATAATKTHARSGTR